MAELINVYEDDLTKGDSYSHNSVVIPMLRYIERKLCHASSQEIYWYDLYSINPGAETADCCQSAEADKSSDN